MSDTAVTPTTDTPTLQPHPETAVPVTPHGMVTDGDIPRLGDGPLATPAAMGVTEPDAVEDPTPVGESAPSLPQGAPVLPTVAPPVATPPPPPVTDPKNAAERFERNAMQLDVASLPILPDAAPAAPVMVESVETERTDGQQADAKGADEHPMAHLMPTKSKPTQASIQAAEQRAIKKAKAKKIKIGVFVAALAVSALAGPPLVSWLTGAINDAGDTSTEPSE